MSTVFITGGGGIIGPGLIRQFAAAGYDIAASYNRSKEKTEAALNEAHEKYGTHVLAVKGNNGVVEDIYEMFRLVKEEFGGIDCMVNNAGMTFGTDFLKATQKDFDIGVNVDFRGTFFCMQQAALNMIEFGKKGVIINTTSNHQEVTFKHAMLYAASKAAIDRMTKTASIELAPYGIRVNAIAPGYTESEEIIEKHKDAEWYKRVTDSIPLHRYALPEEVGKTAVFLAGDGAGIISGTTIFMDGAARHVTGVIG